MAKTPIGLGQFSGKVGGVVFAVYNGEQIVRQYQPKVLNPKSSRQQLQRAKGNLVGRISQIVPWQILQGMGSNRRERRANFLRVALNLASASPMADNLRNISATLANENFIFSRGAVVPTIGVGTMSAIDNKISVTLGKFGGVTDEDFATSGVLVVAVLKSADGRYESIYYRFVSAEEFEGNTMVVEFSHASEGAHSVSVYTAPFKTTDGSSLRTRTEQLTGNANGLNALLINNPSAIPLEWGDSVFIATASYTPTGRNLDDGSKEDEEEKTLSKSKKK